MPRQKTLLGFEPQARDFRLLRGLFHCRLLTIKHAAALFFDGSEEAATKRLQKLVAAKVLRRREGKFNEPNIYEFTAKAFEVLRDHRQLNEYAHFSWTEAMNKRARVGKSKLLHELSVMDVFAALDPAIAALPNFHVVEFGTWPKLYQFLLSRKVKDKQGYLRPQTVKVGPDGFLRVFEENSAQKNGLYDAFLEVDRGSEELKTLVDKATSYWLHYQSGAYAERHGHAGARHKDFPFRVLFVLGSAERLNNFAERLLQKNRDGATQGWLATLRDLLADPLGPIWIRPLDYLNAVEGTPFNPIGKKESRFYIPNPQREKHVAEHVRKWGLFEDPSPKNSHATFVHSPENMLE
jgi:hypothetical protein